MAATSDASGTVPVEASATAQQTFNIGTRRSILARVQADEVLRALKAAWPTHKFDIHAMATAGDNDQKTALHKFKEKSLWTQDLEILLQKGDLDLIVHSLKDVPTQLPIDLDLGCVTKREDPRDALVVKKSLQDQYKSLDDLPEGAVVGTSSLRRIAQLRRHCPHLSFLDIRGNIGSRLAQLDDPDNEYAAIVIAVAGLDRLGMSDRISMYLSSGNGHMLYAVGQGALGIETRKGDQRVGELLSRIGCERTTRAALAERSLLRTLEGGCTVPIGVETEWVSKNSSLQPGAGVGVKPAEDYHNLTGVATSAPENAGGTADATSTDADDELTDELVMRAIVVSLEGDETAEIDARRRVTSREEADQFGWDAAKMLVEKGAAQILEKFQLNRAIIKGQGEA